MFVKEVALKKVQYTVQSQISQSLAFLVLVLSTEKLNNPKAPGADQIPSKLIQKDGSKINEEVHKLFWNKEELPQELKEPIIISIHKKSNLTYNNLRNFSSSTSYRFLANAILARMTLHANEIIEEYKYGLRRTEQHSTIYI